MILTIEQKIICALLLVLALIGCFIFGDVHGAHRVQALVDAQNKANQAAAQLRRVQSSAITTTVVTQYVDRVQVIHDQSAAIIQKVPIYVTAKADAACTIPTGFVRVHNAAVQGNALPAGASATNDAASTVALSTVASTVAGNYGICRATAEQLTALQDWVRQQAAIK